MISPVNVKQAQIARMEIVQTGKTNINHVFDQALLQDTSDFDCYCDKLVTNLSLPAREGFEVLSIRRRQQDGVAWAQRIITTDNFKTTFTCSDITTISGFMREIDDFFNQFHQGLAIYGLLNPQFNATINLPVLDMNLVAAFEKDNRIIRCFLNSRNMLKFRILPAFRDNFFLEFTPKSVDVFELPTPYLALTENLAGESLPFVNAIVANNFFADQSIFPGGDSIACRLPTRIFALLEEIIYLDITVTFPVERELDVHENQESLKQYLFKIPIPRDSQGKLRMSGNNFETVLTESINERTRSMLNETIHCGRLKGGTIEDIRINMFYTTKDNKTFDIQTKADNYVKLSFIFVKRTN